MDRTQKMNVEANVVELKPSANNSRQWELKLPPLLLRVHKLAQPPLQEAMKRFFDNLDDALFELADRSRSDTDQHLYFESMREMRLSRVQVVNTFVLEYQRAMRELVDGPSEPEVDVQATLYESLSLVRNDELEINVAIAGIVSKITSRFSLPLMQLTRRLDVIVTEREITERDNPIGPFALCNAFAKGVESAEIDIKVRIIILKLFERLVMEQLGGLYTSADKLLADAGVVPEQIEIRNAPDHPNSRPAPHQPGPEPSHPGDPGFAGSAGSGNPGFHSGGEVPQFAAHQPSPYSDGYQPTGASNVFSYGQPNTLAPADYGIIESVLRGNLPLGRTPAAPGTPTLSGQQVLGAIANVQQNIAAEPINLDAVPPQLDLRPLILQAADGAQSNAGLGNSEEDLVNLVGMLFDYILNDRNLAIPMKALLGRLQIPYLKVAMLDQAFFTRSGHPARQLLNELSSAGIGWSSSKELKRDALYDLIESIIVRILNRFEDNLEIFKDLLQELREFRQQDDRRNRVVEQRIRDAELGKAKSKEASDTVKRLIHNKAAALELPTAVWDFVTTVWNRVLMFVWLRHGPDSKQWQQNNEVLDELLWASQELTDGDAQSERAQALPRLLGQLNDGLQQIGRDDGPMTAVREALETRIAADEATALEGDAHEVELALAAAPEEVILTPLAPKRAALLPALEARIAALSEGSWLEWTQEDGTPLRGKLTSILGDGEEFVFVNRRGMKVAARTRKALALEFEQQSVVNLDERQLFDRALQTIVGDLRERVKGQESDRDEPS